MIIVSGPCSAESREQVMQTAKELVAGGVKIYRAGVWKPRTRPGCFEGYGIQALEWLKEAKETFGLKIATEINIPSNVKYLVEYGVDIAWLGARTTVNPFIVDAIAAELAKTDIEVYVKNPVCPDADLWMGSIERILKAGCRKVTAIHRGFSQYGVDLYRNAPLWNLPLRVMREMPHIPMLCDPSHIAGKSEFVRVLSYTAMQLGFNGLFVESHCNPDSALSDARQQISSREAISLFEDLKRMMPGI